MIEAKVILGSLGPHHDKPLWTVECTYHRYIHGEVMTHRVFSRNAASSRAIPIKKVLAQVWSDPAMPVEWGSNQPGMQAHTQLAGWRLCTAKTLWRVASKVACCFAWGFIKVGLAKQIGNRILEPWQWMHTLITATEWDNFFELRDHQDAQPEFRELAKKIREAMERYPLQRLGSTDWHLPYIRVEEKKGKTEGDLLKMSSARCARVSYLNHDSVSPTLEEDSRLFERLVGSSPMHASPVEHQALPAQTGYRSGNFIGWKQYRQVLLATKPDAKNLQEVVDGSGF